MNRREFIKALGVGSVAGIATVPVCVADGDELFVLEIDQRLDARDVQRIQRVWEAVFTGPAPKLLVLDKGAQLKRAGRARNNR